MKAGGAKSVHRGRISPAAAEYDRKIAITMPMYGLFHTETIDLVKSIKPAPEKWLDTGCGTGNLIFLAARIFDGTTFVLADPSPEMALIAREKLFGPKSSLAGRARIKLLPPVASESIDLPEQEFDVVTAIQAHHYLEPSRRGAAVMNCWRLLKPGGIFIVFENIRPVTSSGTEIGLNRWKNFQIAQGKRAAEAAKHVARFGKEYLPIPIQGHLDLLHKTGFSVAELFWFSYLQAGFYALK